MLTVKKCTITLFSPYLETVCLGKLIAKSISFKIRLWRRQSGGGDSDGSEDGVGDRVGEGDSGRGGASPLRGRAKEEKTRVFHRRGATAATTLERLRRRGGKGVRGGQGGYRKTNSTGGSRAGSTLLLSTHSEARS